MSAFTLNGHPVDLRMDAETPLLWALRCGANLTGTKYGCGTGECGACLVMVDGQALPSCQMTLAQAEGRAITTIEGLSPDRSHALQQALVAEGAINAVSAPRASSWRVPRCWPPMPTPAPMTSARR